MNWWDIPLATAFVYAFGVFVLATAGALVYSPDHSDLVRRKTARLVFDSWKWPVNAAKHIQERWADMRADARADDTHS